MNNKLTKVSQRSFYDEGKMFNEEEFMEMFTNSMNNLLKRRTYLDFGGDHITSVIPKIYENKKYKDIFE